MQLFSQFRVLDLLSEQPRALKIGKEPEVEQLTRISVQNLQDVRRIHAFGRSQHAFCRHHCVLFSFTLSSRGSRRELLFAECPGFQRGAIHAHVLSLIMQGLATDGHRPYRDSKFTHCLRNALGGNSLTYLLVHVKDSHVETLEGLSWAQKAQNEALEVAHLPFRPSVPLAEATWIAPVQPSI